MFSLADYKDVLQVMQLEPYGPNNFIEAFNFSTNTWELHSSDIVRDNVLQGVRLLYRTLGVRDCPGLEEELQSPSIRFNRKRPLEGFQTSSQIKKRFVPSMASTIAPATAPPVAPAAAPPVPSLVASPVPFASYASDSVPASTPLVPSLSCAAVDGVPSASLSSNSPIDVSSSSAGLSEISVGPLTYATPSMVTTLAYGPWPAGQYFVDIEKGLDMLAARPRQSLKQDVFRAIFGVPFHASTVLANERILGSATDAERAHFRGLGRAPGGLWTTFRAFKRTQDKQRTYLPEISLLVPPLDAVAAVTGAAASASVGQCSINPSHLGPDADSARIDTPAPELLVKGPCVAGSETSTHDCDVRGALDDPMHTPLRIWTMSASSSADDNENPLGDLPIPSFLRPSSYTPPDNRAVPATVTRVPFSDPKYNYFRVSLNYIGRCSDI